MELTKEKSILIIAPDLIAESLSLKLTSVDNNITICLDPKDQEFLPDLIIWNILNYQSEDLIRIELLKLKERWDGTKILVIFSGNSFDRTFNIPSISSEGILLNPSVEKVLDTINIIINGGRVFDNNGINNFDSNVFTNLSFNQKILLSGLKQIDTEIQKLLNYINDQSISNIYKFILKGRLRELITAKSLLIFIWGGSIEAYPESFLVNESSTNQSFKSETLVFEGNDPLEIWNLIVKRTNNKFHKASLTQDALNTSIILSGLKNEFISKLICNVVYELDILIKNIKEEELNDFEIELPSLLNELRRNSLSRITDNYLRIKRNGESISLTEFIFNEFRNEEEDIESHDMKLIIDPIINNKPLDYDGKLLPLYERDSFKILESIVINWSLRTANILASEIFNYCSDWPELRTYLINEDIQSTRNFERFRNNVNNYNRWHNNINMPIYLYESKREYLDFVDNMFIRYYKNENREKDLNDLHWLQKQVTLLVEIRDAIAPQLEIALKYIGNIFVTILTKIVGKSIGLIGKGILQGLGRSVSK